MISHMMSYMISCTKHQIMVRLSSQVRFVNDSIDRARPESVLYGLEHIEDPSDKIIEVHLASLRWDMEQRKFGLTGVGLQNVHDLSMEFLDTLEENMPERAGGVLGWNFEKPHSVVHKVRDIILLGWSEIFGHQGPEHGHINNIKRLAGCVNNKEVYLSVLKAHARAGHLSYLQGLEEDLKDAAAEEDEAPREEDPVTDEQLETMVETGSSELGLRYPTLQAMFAGKKTRQRIQVQAHHI